MTSESGSGVGAVALEQLADRFGEVARRIDQASRRDQRLKSQSAVYSRRLTVQSQSAIAVTVMTHSSSCPAVSTARCSPRTKRSRRACCRCMSASAWRGSRRRSRWSNGCCASPVFAGKVDPLTRVEFTMRDVYPPTHWAIRGEPPAYDTPDEDVYLTGRNLVLLTKAGVVAARHGAHRIALGPLAGNPFPDARPEFFASMSNSLSLGLDHAIEIATPFLEWEKEDVIKRGVELDVPLELTLSCMNPRRVQRVHGCIRCSRCRAAGASRACADALRTVQQVPRTPRCVRGRRRSPIRSRYANRNRADVYAVGTAWNAVEPLEPECDVRIADDRRAEQADRRADQRDRR